MTSPPEPHDRRQLQQLVSGLSEGVVLVGFDQAILWANEAALALHGASCLADLGRDLDEYRSRFRLTRRDTRQPLHEGDFPIDRVIAGEVPHDVTVEVSPVASPDRIWTHAIRCLVLTDAGGAPDVLVLVIRDETRRYEAEDRFEAAFAANPAPAIICRLSDLCYVRVNRGFLQMTGCQRHDLIGTSIYAFDILTGPDGNADALERLKAGQTVPQREASLPLPDGSRKVVIVAGQPIDLGDEPCMLFTFVDLDARRKAETATRQSEEKFAAAFMLSPAALALCSLPLLEFVEVNAALSRLVALPEDRLLGRAPGELGLWPDRSIEARIRAALASGDSLSGLAVQVRTEDGAVECLLSAGKVVVADAPCVLLVLQDITEQKRTEAELLAAIEAVMSDTSWFSRSVVEKLGSLRQAARGDAGVEAEALTDREREVLELICQGASDAEMAEALCLSRHTIRNHLASLYRKLGVKRRGAAVAWARERGIGGRAGARAAVRRQKG